MRLATVLGSALLAAAAPAAADWFGAPALSAAYVDDDNLFFTPANPQPDQIVRVTPAFEAGYRSAPLSWRASASVDAERYDRHPELDSDRAREAASLELERRSTSRLTLAGSASYARTQSPGELAPSTGLEFGRQQAERFSVAPSLAIRFDRRASGFAGYGFTRDRLEAAPGSDTHELTLGAGRRASRRDTASIEYRYRRLDAAGETHASHAVLGGLTRRFSEATTGSLLAGPRFAEGSVDLEAAASLRRELLRGELSLDYARTETTVIGLAGAATTQSIGASASSAFGGVVEWRVASSLASTEAGGSRAEALIFDLGLGYRVTRIASVFGAWSRREQRGRLETGDAEPVDRDVLMVGVVLRAPSREDEERERRSRERSPSAADRPWLAGEDEPGEEDSDE